MPGLDFIETQEAPSALSSGVSREEETVSLRKTATPVESDTDLTLPISGTPKQTDEFVSLPTETEPSESAELVPSVPIEASEPEALSSNGGFAEPSETGEMFSNSSITARIEDDKLLSSPTPTSLEEPEDTFTVAKSTTPGTKNGESVGLNASETNAAEDDAVATFGATPLDEIEKAFAKFSLPGRGEIYESRANGSTGYKVAGKRNTISAIGIGRTRKYLAIAAVLVFLSSLLTYWMWPVEDVSRTPEVTARSSDDSRPGSGLQTPILERSPGTKQGPDIQWQSARQDGSRSPSLNQRAESTLENSQPNRAASNPSRLAAIRTTEPGQLDSEKPLPASKREKAEKKKVTADDLINDKKRITVDDLINDN